MDIDNMFFDYDNMLDREYLDIKEKENINLTTISNRKLISIDIRSF